jgi:hypothetical protein
MPNAGESKSKCRCLNTSETLAALEDLRTLVVLITAYFAAASFTGKPRASGTKTKARVFF